MIISLTLKNDNFFNIKEEKSAHKKKLKTVSIDNLFITEEA